MYDLEIVGRRTSLLDLKMNHADLGEPLALSSATIILKCTIQLALQALLSPR